MFVDGIVGILIGAISASVSALLITNLQLLTGWLVVSVSLVLAPVLWWMPFIGYKKAETIAVKYAKSRHNDLETGRPIVWSNKLSRWHYHIKAGYSISNPELGGFDAVVNAKCGNIVSFEEDYD